MSIFESIILGLIQGMGEFLPISSSGHLIIMPYLFGWMPHSLSFDIMLHLGTLSAIVIYFFFDWAKLLKEGFLSLRYRTLQGPPERKIFWYIVIATMPAVIFGKVLTHKAETVFRQPLLVSLALGVFALFFYLAQKINRNKKTLVAIRLKDAILIGLAQAFAIFPGVSRSGVTITSALALNFRREEAVRFSFLLSAPVILGAGILKIKEIFSQGLSIQSYVLWVGFLVSGLSGILSIHFLLKFAQRYSFNVFIFYRIIICLVVISVFILRKT